MNTHLGTVFPFISSNLNFRVFFPSLTRLPQQHFPENSLCLLTLLGEKRKDAPSINAFLTMLIHCKDWDLHFTYMEWYKSHERTPTEIPKEDKKCIYLCFVA